MTKLNDSGLIQVRVKEGSALQRLLLESTHKTVSGALHEVAAKAEANRDQVTQFSALIAEGRRRDT